jgi:hypothetical protein
VESRGPSAGKVRECNVANRNLQHFSPCLCQLRTDVLPPMSKYWTYWSHTRDMGPVNRCSISSINAWLSLLLQWLCLERNWVADLRIDQPTCRGLCREPFCSGVVGSVQLRWVSMKGYHVRGLSTESVRVVYVDQRKKRMWHVYHVSLTGCTLIRIAATL